MTRACGETDKDAPAVMGSCFEEIVEEAGLGSKQKLIGRAVDLIVYMEKTTDGIRRIISFLTILYLMH